MATAVLQGMTVPTTEAENTQTIERFWLLVNAHLDAKSPMISPRILAVRARLTACIPPIADVLSALFVSTVCGGTPCIAGRARHAFNSSGRVYQGSHAGQHVDHDLGFARHR